MGWYYEDGKTKDELIRELIEPNKDATGRVIGITLKHKLGRDGALWTLRECYFHEGGTQTYIGCDLLEKGHNTGWGYKPMDESCGPCYYDCPLAWLDLASPAEVIGGYSASWRAKVRAYWAERRAS